MTGASRYSQLMNNRYEAPLDSHACARQRRVETRRSHRRPGWGLLPGRRALLTVIGSLCLAAYALPLAAKTEPQAYLALLDESFFLQQVEEPLSEPVQNHLVALGAMQKIRGVWSPRRSERVTGERVAYTWKIDEGFTIADALDVLDAALAGEGDTEALYTCTGVSCGSSVQWANRVFRERLLYGTQASQEYRAYRMTHADRSFRLLVYGAARTVDRQYLRAELLEVTEVSD